LAKSKTLSQKCQHKKGLAEWLRDPDREIRVRTPAPPKKKSIQMSIYSVVVTVL
jgi:hypothetical protein